MKSKKFIGIDIGLGGAISVLEKNSIIEIIPMPVILVSASKREYNIQEIVNFLKKYKDAIVIVEKTQALPKIGAVQSHNLGKGFGIMAGILIALNMRHHIIHPKTWQLKLFRDCPGDNTKTKSILIAQRLFPSFRFVKTERSKKIDHNMCDAVLLAFYGQNYLYNE
jgi:hypothetical protein